jgi:hypothetical protein
MGIVDPIAMTNAMATGGMEFGGGAALGAVLLGLLAASAGGILLTRARSWPTRSRLSRFLYLGRPARLAGAAK